MYIPSQFKVSDTAQALDLVRLHPLGTIVVAGPHGVELAQAPCMLNEHGDALEFHLARANPMARILLQSQITVQVLFNGPDAYVSPTWYTTPDSQVPTWNYASVLVRGQAVSALDEDGLVASLRRMSDAFEGNTTPQWTLDRLGAQHRAAMLRAIVGFSLTIDAVEGKFKVSQNRTPIDRERVRQAHLASADPRARSLAEWMSPPRAVDQS